MLPEQQRGQPASERKQETDADQPRRIDQQRPPRGRRAERERIQRIGRRYNQTTGEPAPGALCPRNSRNRPYIRSSG